MSEHPLQPRRTADGSFSLFSARHGEGFHSAEGALTEARSKFVEPAGLERFGAGQRLRVVEIAVGTGTNTVALLEALQQRKLEIAWWGLECDPEPLRLARSDPGFRRQWAPSALAAAEQHWQGEQLLWGDARRRLPELLPALEGSCDLVLLDAFSPRRCPELWTLEFLSGLAGLLAPQGRLLSYCSAAAVRRSLEQAGLELAAIRCPQKPADGAGSGSNGSGDRSDAGAGSLVRFSQAVCSDGGRGDPAWSHGRMSDGLMGDDPWHHGSWSGGTVASPSPLPAGGILRPLSPMELEHIASRAGEPYRDPGGQTPAAEILAARQRAQAASDAESGSAWQRRWGQQRHHRRSRPAAGGAAAQDR